MAEIEKKKQSRNTETIRKSMGQILEKVKVGTPSNVNLQKYGLYINLWFVRG